MDFAQIFDQKFENGEIFLKKTKNLLIFLKFYLIFFFFRAKIEIAALFDLNFILKFIKNLKIG